MDLKSNFKAIEKLIKPLSEQVSSLDQALTIKTENEDINCIEGLKYVDQVQKKLNLSDSSPRVKFLQILLQRLNDVNILYSKDNELLISLQQQKLLKTSIEMISCIGILPYIKNGIGVPLEKKVSKKLCFHSKSQQIEETLLLLNYSVLGVMSLYESELYQTLITSKHLVDLIAANFQLIIEKQAVDSKLCSKFLKVLIEDTYQPLVIQELMVMLGNKDIPRKLHRWISDILSDRLTSEGGLLAMLRAILDLTGDCKDSPHYWEHISVLAKILTAPKHSSLYPQLLELLKGKNSEYRQVAVMSLKLLSEKNTEDCNKYFVTPLLQPIIRPATEHDMGISLEAIHCCCGISAPWSVSPNVFKLGFIHFFKLYSKTRLSVSYLKPKISDITYCIMADEKTNIKEIFDAALFENLNVIYQLGSEGGVYTDDGSDDSDPENIADSILYLVLSYGNTSVKVKIFNMLLELIIENKDLVKQLIYAKMLAEICNDSDVHKSLGEDPSCIVTFIKGVIEEHQQFGDDIVCLGLMVLGIIVDSPVKHKPVDWNIFKCLVEPLKNFKSPNSETNVLANELYELILSHGVVKKNKERVEKVQTNLAKALEESVDPLLPIRAHGLRELGRLIKAKDQETLKQMDTILFIFKENLNDDDSYVYLSAVEGLTSLASSFPDEVLTSLIEEYMSSKHCTENRLKVGEILLKLGRILNEMAVVYKKELISCFLIGCRDQDELVRASSLSNLGELCKILSFRITPYLVEILECIKAIYETDKFPEPRRAAVMVLTLLFKGLGEGVLNTLEPLLLDIYKSLKHIYKYDKDDITRLHAQMALEELHASTITFLFPIKSLEKRIFVLDPPT
ncbi:transport and Golgi organization protein 6 homolog [Halyomorpha halys]|uniref:transport and Golgi organization protein 6 homolog n=1 Tax=Halyomorpha halys TaxID=286706 RepID=UPI0006D4F994|nr:transport and Golgi organization protein 6 homolog [Halyomorpha halys]